MTDRVTSVDVADPRGRRDLFQALSHDVVPLSCCTQYSGRREIRCPRAGSATALTSSGVTKSRPTSMALTLASFSTARLPRGLAPTCTRGLGASP